jgi:hypothetical protein
MLLHINPRLNLTNVAEHVARRMSAQFAVAARSIPGYATWRGAGVVALTQRLAEVATPLVASLAWVASDVLTVDRGMSLDNPRVQ